MHKKTLVAVVAACALLSHAAFAAKPSFKCGKKDAHEAEVLICQDDELAKLDVTLNNLYKTVLKNTPASKKKALKAEQSGWVRGRNECWKADDKHACIKGEYESRISELKDR